MKEKASYVGKAAAVGLVAGGVAWGLSGLFVCGCSIFALVVLVALNTVTESPRDKNHVSFTRAMDNAMLYNTDLGTGAQIAATEQLLRQQNEQKNDASRQ